MQKYNLNYKFKYITIIKNIPNTSPKKVIGKCICGAEKEYFLSNLIPKKTARYTLSCGCKRAEICSNKMTTHGMSKSRFHRIWRSIKWRTSGKATDLSIKCYLNKEVKWKCFNDFYIDMYAKYIEHINKYGEKNTSIDRVDNTKGYSKENCRWATNLEQANNKTNNRFITYKGEKDTVANWSRNVFGKTNFQATILNRLKRGWSVNKTMETPIRRGKYNLHLFK